ncbi:MAG: hypothetical protein ABIH38_04985 [Patescibacteria group bacterium]
MKYINKKKTGKDVLRAGKDKKPVGQRARNNDFHHERMLCFGRLPPG